MSSPLEEANLEIARLNIRNAELTHEATTARAALKGRTTPPTDEEIDAHEGVWLVFCDHSEGYATRLVSGEVAKLFARRQGPSMSWVWHPFDDRSGEHLTWPKVETPK